MVSITQDSYNVILSESPRHNYLYEYTFNDKINVTFLNKQRGFISRLSFKLFLPNVLKFL